MNTIDQSSHIFGSDDRPVFRIMIACLSLAFAVLIASLETIRPTASGFAFELSWRTGLIFAISGAIMVPCFNTLFLSSSQRRRLSALALVVLTGVVAFLYPLRFVPVEKYGAIFTGLGMAACFLATIGGMLFTISRFVNAEEPQRELETPVRGDDASVSRPDYEYSI